MRGQRAADFITPVQRMEMVRAAEHMSGRAEMFVFWQEVADFIRGQVGQLDAAGPLSDGTYPLGPTDDPPSVRTAALMAKAYFIAELGRSFS